MILAEQWIAAVGLVVGTIGLVVSIVAVIIALRQISRTRTAAKSAKSAADSAHEAMRLVASMSDLSQIINQMEYIRELHRTQEWVRAMDRYAPLRRLLTETKGRAPEQDQEVFNRATMQLSAMEKEISEALDQNLQISSTKINATLSDIEQSLVEKLVELENALAVTASTRTNENDRVLTKNWPTL